LNQWFETLTAREQDALVLSRAQAPDAGFRNVSQSLGREHSTSFCTETLGPHDSPKPAAFCGAAKAARLMLGQEALLFQGFPLCSFLALVEKMKKSIDMHEQPSSCSRRKRHSEPKTIAGNAMALPVLLAIAQSAVASLLFRPASTAATAEETADALSALEVLSAVGS